MCISYIWEIYGVENKTWWCQTIFVLVDVVTPPGLDELHIIWCHITHRIHENGTTFTCTFYWFFIVNIGTYRPYVDWPYVTLVAIVFHQRWSHPGVQKTIALTEHETPVRSHRFQCNGNHCLCFLFVKVTFYLLTNTRTILYFHIFIFQPFKGADFDLFPIIRNPSFNCLDGFSQCEFYRTDDAWTARSRPSVANWEAREFVSTSLQPLGV